MDQEQEVIANSLRQTRAPQLTTLTAVGLLIAFSPAGCRSPAHNEVYTRKMANEIRVLEDQLYDADYQNRVLRDELKRAKANCEPCETSDLSRDHTSITNEQSYGPPIDPMPIESVPIESAPTPIPDSQPIDSHYPPPVFDQSGETILDEGFETTEPSTLGTPVPKQDYGPKTDDIDEPDTKTEGGGFELVPTPPAEPEPPGPESFQVPKVLPGSPLPPKKNGEEDPAGKVRLPKSLEALNYSKPKLPPLAAPEHIQLHPSLSGGHQFDQDDDVDGLYVVINVIDKNGNAVNLRDFDIEAAMTIVVLDPKLDASQARVGRWDFAAEEISKFVRSIPVDGFHVPIQWQDNEPTGDEVIVHVRLQAESEEMNCQGKISLKRDSVMAKWLPRGGPKTR